MEAIGLGVSDFKIYHGFSNTVVLEGGRTRKCCPQYQAWKEQPLAPGVKRTAVIEERRILDH
jgi:hypothetical protein